MPYYRNNRRNIKKYGGLRDRRPKQYVGNYRKYQSARQAVARHSGYLRMGGARMGYPLGSELKFYEDSFDFGAVPLGGSVQDTIIGINEGTGETARVGRKICLKKIMIRATAYMPATTDSGNVESNSVRFMVVLDKQCNGTAATIAALLHGTEHYHAFNELGNRDRFVVLADKFINLNKADTGVSLYKTFFINKNVHLPIEYQNTGSGVADIRSNNIFLVASAQLTGAGTSQPQLYGKSRVRYTDH